MIKIKDIRLWVKNVVLIILFANFIELLLPNNKFRNYVRVVIGFFVILVIIVPVLELMNFNLTDFNFELNKGAKGGNLTEILAAGEKLKSKKLKKMRENYKKRLTHQIQAVINLNSQLKDPKIKIKLNNSNKLKKITIDTTQAKIDPVQINLAKPEKKVSSEQKYLKTLLVNLYGLDKEKIEVR